MNPDQPSREQIEARITALLLGELPAEEAALLRYTIAQDPALKQLHDELQATLVLVREAAKHPATVAPEKSAPLKLSGERREQLLAHFKTPRPKPEPLFWLKRIEVPSLINILVAVAVIAVLAAMLLPALSKSKSRARNVVMLSEQRQRELEQTVSDKKLATASPVDSNTRIWSADNRDRHAMEVTTYTAAGGAFGVMTNDISGSAPQVVTIAPEATIAPPPVTIVLPQETPESGQVDNGQVLSLPRGGAPAAAKPEAEGGFYSQSIVGYVNLQLTNGTPLELAKSSAAQPPVTPESGSTGDRVPILGDIPLVGTRAPVSVTSDGRVQPAAPSQNFALQSRAANNTSPSPGNALPQQGFQFEAGNTLTVAPQPTLAPPPGHEAGFAADSGPIVGGVPLLSQVNDEYVMRSAHTIHQTATQVKPDSLSPNAAAQGGDTWGKQADSTQLTQDAKLLYDLGHYSEAQAELNTALAQNPENPTAIYYRNLIQQNEQRRDLALHNTDTQVRREQVEKQWIPPAATASFALSASQYAPNTLTDTDGGRQSLTESPEKQKLATRTFQVDPNAFYGVLENVNAQNFGSPQPNGSGGGTGGGGGGGRDQNSGAVLGGVNAYAEVGGRLNAGYGGSSGGGSGSLTSVDSNGSHTSGVISGAPNSANAPGTAGMPTVAQLFRSQSSSLNWKGGSLGGSLSGPVNGLPPITPQPPTPNSTFAFDDLGVKDGVKYQTNNISLAYNLGLQPNANPNSTTATVNGSLRQAYVQVPENPTGNTNFEIKLPGNSSASSALAGINSYSGSPSIGRNLRNQNAPAASADTSMAQFELPESLAASLQLPVAPTNWELAAASIGNAGGLVMKTTPNISDQSKLREFAQANGVDLNSPGHALFYNEKLKKLFVKGTKEEQEKLGMAINQFVESNDIAALNKLETDHPELQQRNRMRAYNPDVHASEPTPTLDAAQLSLINQQSMELQKQYEEQSTELAKLKEIQKSNPQALREVLPQMVNDPTLNDLTGKLNDVEQRLASLKADYSETNTIIQGQKRLADELSHELDDRINGVMAGLESQTASKKAQREALADSIAHVRADQEQQVAELRPYYDAKRDLEQKLRMHELLYSKLEAEKLDASLPKNSMVQVTDWAAPGKTRGLWQKLAGQVESNTRIKIENDVNDVQGLNATPMVATEYDPHFIQTTLEIMQSDVVLGKVVDALNLESTWADKNGGEKMKKSQAIAEIKKHLDLQPVPNTKLVSIGVKGSDPKETADLANAVAKAYATYRFESRRALTTNGVAQLEDQFNEQTKDIELAQKNIERLGKELHVEETPAPAVEQIDVPVAPVRKPAPNAPVPQPEILTSSNAFSTFSLNVSDVSFKFAEASLQNGKLPDTAAIRSEEFINAFDYRDPEAAAGQPMAFMAERAHYPFAHNRDLLRFSIKTAAAGRQNGRALNLVLLLDNSGSMERADRVAIIREALRVLVTQLQPQDTVSVVTFARTARLWADGVSGDKAGETLDKVGGITPEGGTNLEEAMRLAYETAHRHYLASGMNRVVLLTDGAANLGNVEPAALKEKVEAQRKQSIALDCFGIGWEDYNDDLLEQLSSNGGGRYAFLNSPEDAAKDFATKLAGALQITAADVKVQVEFNPQRVISYRQIGYAKHQLTKQQFRDNTVAAGEIAAQEAGNALYTIEANPNGDGPIATVHVRYRIPGTQDYRELSWDVAYDGKAPALDQSSPAMRLAATAGAFSEWLAASPFAQEVTPDALLKYLSGVPEVYGADDRPKQLETMISEARGLAGK